MAPPTILLAEPDASARNRVCAALEGLGYLVRSVQSAASALSERGRFTPDLIIQALFFPDMDGFDLARKLRCFEGGAAIPMVALLGLETAVGADRARAGSAGFVAALTRPVQPAEVIAAVEVHIPVPPPRRPDVGKGRRILLADDNPVQLRLLQCQLEAAGFRVAVAPGGAEALTLARQDRPDAIVSDVLMPHLDGFQLCLEVRQDPALARIPVLLLSFQYFEPSDVELAAKAGATRFMTRPVHASDLVEAVLAVLSDEVQLVAAPMQPDEVDHAHHDRVKRQLERQLGLSAALAQSCTIQATQLSLLGGMADALSRGADVENVV
ncbi:MAG: response regulator, partial [Polyangia bacterium]